jgi:DHA1 family inner membrane transport protein
MVTENPNTFNPSSPLSIAAYILTAGVAATITNFAPIVIGAYVDILGFTDQRAGYIFSAEMAGFTIGAALVIVLLPLMNWHHIVRLGLVALIGGNLIAIGLTAYWPMLTIRLLTGVGAGILMAITTVSVGSTRDPDRIFGLWITAQVMPSVLVVPLLPKAILHYGLAAPFMIIAIFGILVFCLYRHFPEKAVAKTKASTVAGTPRALLLGVIGIIGTFIFYGGQSAVWAFVERIGTASGLSNQAIGNAIFLALLAGTGGGLLAAVIGKAFGRVLPLFGSMVLSATAIIVLAGEPALIPYTLAVVVLYTIWVYSSPVLNGVIANLDKGGRLLAATSMTFCASISAGPALASALLDNSGNYNPVIWIGLTALPIGFAIVYFAAREK